MMPARRGKIPLLIAVCAFLLGPWTSSAEAAAPETLLAKESVAYIRFDGLSAHRDAYEKTVAAQIIREELKPLMDFASAAILSALGPEVLSESLLQGAAPDELLELQQASAGVPRSLSRLWSHGVAIGVELIQPVEARWQVTAVFPDSGEAETRDALLGAFRLLAKAYGAELVKEEINGRQTYQFDAARYAKLACWAEGEHVVLTVGSEKPERTIEFVTEGSREDLTVAAAYQNIQGFTRYPTCARGFVDAEGLLSVLAKHIPPATVIGKQLGLTGLQQFAFQLGFEGDYQRSTIELTMPGERTGLLQALGRLEPISIDGLPPIAPGASYVSAAGLELTGVYDALLEVVQIGFGFAKPAGANASVKEQIAAFEKQLGVRIREDLLGSLASPVLIYSDPDEGALSMGATVAIRVKDTEKLASTLQTLIQSAGTLTGADIRVKESTYRSVGLNVVELGVNQFPFTPTYTIHDGWLVAALYPQPVKGFVLRAGEDAAAWNPSPLVARVIEAEREFRSEREVKIVGVTESDPRPTIREILAVAPLFAMMYNRFGADPGSARFDSTILPNAQAICEHVTPGVSVMVDDGQSIRVESYATLPLGFQLTGLRSYYMLLLPLAFRF